MLTLNGTSTLSLDNNTQMLLGCGVLFASSSLFLRSKLIQSGPDWFGWGFFLKGVSCTPHTILKTELENTTFDRFSCMFFTPLPKGALAGTISRRLARLVQIRPDWRRLDQNDLDWAK